jgi:hypothetical protein
LLMKEANRIYQNTRALAMMSSLTEGLEKNQIRATKKKASTLRAKS